MRDILDVIFFTFACVFATIFLIILSSMASDLLESCMFGTMNETERQAYYEAQNKTTSYNVTILDKRYDEDMLFDDYTVTYQTESGEIKQDNNMTLFYTVEKGHNYNFTYQRGSRISIQETGV